MGTWFLLFQFKFSRHILSQQSLFEDTKRFTRAPKLADPLRSYLFFAAFNDEFSVEDSPKELKRLWLETPGHEDFSIVCERNSNKKHPTTSLKACGMN